MNLVRHDNPSAFQERAAPYLLRHEARHNMMLGLCHGLIHTPERFETPYLATMEDKGRVVAAAMRTPPHPLLVSHTDEPGVFALLAADAAALPNPPPGVNGAAPEVDLFAHAWQARTGRRAEEHRALRIYQLKRVTPPAGVPGRLRPATVADRPLLVRWIAAFDREALGESRNALLEQLVDRRLHDGSLFLWDHNGPAAMAGFTRPTQNGIGISLVYTPPERRKRGYASACVAALSQNRLNAGRRFCFLYTDRSNPTSNHIYQTIGYHPVCYVKDLRFVADKKGKT